MEIKEILVIFKTHLDIGFTDFSNEIIKGYIDGFIPSAIKTANELKKRSSDASFIWTTGSWLIEKYLDSADENNRQILIDAINAGEISWHGLPFTTHTELMTKELFEYGLSISQKLDKQFCKKTIAAKMTDVPGHTKAMIPLLAKAGIELLHIGVNPASAVPETPEIFRWKADSGEEVTIIYNSEYGNFTPIGNSGTALYFAHTSDNQGAQTADEVDELFKKIKEKYPSAVVKAATLNDVALAVRKIRNTLPIITEEIGDSWIHGTAADPKKLSQFKALQRIFAKTPDGKDKDALAKGLIMIPEHTWGLDEKTFLHDNTNYIKSDFHSCRKQDNYIKMEKSWVEQRQFMYDAVNELSDNIKNECNNVMAECVRCKADISGMRQLKPNEAVCIKGCKIAIDNAGAISLLEKDGKIIADSGHSLFRPLYEQFSYDEYNRLHERYHRINDDWAIEDFTKIGMECAADKYFSCSTSAKAYTDGKKIVIKYSFDETAVRNMGAPAEADAIISFNESSIEYDFAWFKKDANRVAEAIWLAVNPIATNPQISKLSCKIDPYKVISRGNRNLHATDDGVIWNEVTIKAVDSSVVSPGYPHLVDFVNTIPEIGEPFHFNLYNNVWGTNFPMWYEEDARFRFVIEF